MTARHGIVTRAAPWLTAGDTANAKPAAFEKTVLFDGLQKIFRTGRPKAAACSWSPDEVYDRGEKSLVEANEKSDHRLHEDGRRMPARRAVLMKSARKSSSDASAARQRAMITRCKPSTNKCCWALTISRKRRRIRFRRTAWPTFLEVISPNWNFTNSGL